MARKQDVELVIRAKNEANKAINSLEDALRTLTAQQQSTSKEAGKTESALDRIGGALNNLTKSFKGATLGDKLASEMAKATGQMERLEKAVQGTVAENVKLSKSAAEAAASTARLKGEVTQAAAALDAQRGSVAKTKETQKELNAAIAAGTAERTRLLNADERGVGKIEKQEAAVAKARQRYEELAQAVLLAVNPTKTLSDRFEASVVALDKQETKLTELSGAYVTNRAQVERTVATLSDLQGKASQTATALEAQQKAVSAAEQNFKGLQIATRTAASAEKDLQGSAAATVETLQRQQASLAQAQGDFVQLSAASGKAAAAQAELGIAVRNGLLKVFGEQHERLVSAQSDYTRTQAAVKALAVEMKSTSAPSQELVDKFNKSVIAAKAAKDTYIIQQAALHQMRQALRSAGTDFDALTGAQQRFAGTEASVAAALGDVKARAELAAKAQAELAAAGEKANQGVASTGRSARDAANAMGAGSEGTSRFALAMKDLYGESRTAMSFTQRLRGEVLSLIAAYGGIYAAVSGIKQVIDAYRQLDAANNRLQVVFNGNKNQSAQEMDFLRRTADRLGISFGELANQYSQFAVATKDTNLEGERTRKIFVSVAEAAKVNNTSLEDQKGIFLALTQIVSKGSVQMEELRQQLGDRLPGALQLMAAGVGVSTEALIKMMEQGQISSGALVGFADQLDKKFGPQLQEALKGVNAQIGFFQQNIFSALLAIGNNGAMEGFTKFLTEINRQFKSPEGQTYFRLLGQAISGVFTILQFFVENIRTVVVAMGALVAVKVAPFFVALAASFTGTAGAAGRSVAAINLFRAATGGAQVSALSLTGALVGLRAAWLALLGSTGIGLLVAGIGAGIAYWVTRTSDAERAMSAFEGTVDKVKNAFDRSNGSIDEMKKKLTDVSKTQLLLQVDTFKQQLSDATANIKPPVDAFKLDKNGTVQRINEIVTAFKEGRVSVGYFTQALDDIAAADPKLDKTLVVQLQAAAKEADTAKNRIEGAEAILRILDGTATDADKTLLGLSKSTKNLNDDLGVGAKSFAAYNEAIDTLKNAIPALAAEMKRLKAFAEIDPAGMTALAEAFKGGSGKSVMDAFQFYSGARGAINEQFANDAIKDVASNTKITADTLKVIMAEEGIKTKAYRDSGGTPTIGLGNTTIDGRPVQMGDTVTEAQAYQLAVKALADIAGSLDAKIEKPITDSMRNALLSYAYNVGQNSDGIKRVVDLINTGAYEAAQEAIKNGVNTVKGVPNAQLTERRSREAALFGKDGLGGYEIAKSLTEEEKKKAEKAKEYHDTVGETLKTQKYTLEQDKEGGLQAEINKEIYKAQNEAKKAGTELSKEELDLIKQNTTEKYNQEHAEDAGTEAKKKAKDAEKEINAEVQLRTQLQKQLQLQLNQGDLSGAEATRSSLEQVNQQLTDNIPKAIAMWQAIGGVEADAAITKLKAVQTSLQGAGTQIVVNWKQVDQTFAQTATNGISQAIDSIGQAIAGTKSWGDAIKGVGVAFLKFAASFLEQVAQMIIKQAILNALQSATSGSAGSSGGFFQTVANAVGALVKHDGGLVMAGMGPSRAVAPEWFQNARRYHSGGIAGLRPNEVPAILEQGEEILRSDSPRHMLNGGGGASAIRNVLVMDPNEISNAMKTSAGEQVVMSFIRANAPTIKRLLRA